MTKHVHILGICGTFMGGVALLARELGFAVSGSDAGAYAPMSTQLETAGIRLCEGYLAEHLQPAPDLVVVGNVLSRGNPAVEYLLNSRIPYISGPQWLAENLLRSRWVLAAQLRPLNRPGPGLERVAKANGFSLHAGVSCKGHQKNKRERLCRYIARPLMAVPRLSLSSTGMVVYTLKTPYRALARTGHTS